MQAPPATVFAVLADGWSYPAWVVGASRIRDVEGEWPAKGSRLHHSVGVWPLLIDDDTEVLDVEPDRRLVLQARGWPAGEARVELTISPDGEGSLVRMAESPDRGPAERVFAPLIERILPARNRESLRRLAAIAEGRARNGFPHGAPR